VAHLYGAVACYDPKMAGYIICITHDPEFELGQFIGKSAQEDLV
jgi:CRISPR-associated protein Csx3